jgi:hypothetical protein
MYSGKIAVPPSGGELIVFFRRKHFFHIFFMYFKHPR